MKKVMTALAKMAAVFGIMAVSSWALYMEYVRGKRVCCFRKEAVSSLGRAAFYFGVGLPGYVSKRVVLTIYGVGFYNKDKD